MTSIVITGMYNTIKSEQTVIVSVRSVIKENICGEISPVTHSTETKPSVCSSPELISELLSVSKSAVSRMTPIIQTSSLIGSVRLSLKTYTIAEITFPMSVFSVLSCLKSSMFSFRRNSLALSGSAGIRLSAPDSLWTLNCFFCIMTGKRRACYTGTLSGIGAQGG